MATKPILKFWRSGTRSVEHYDDTIKPTNSSMAARWEEEMPDKVLVYDYSVHLELVNDELIRCSHYDYKSSETEIKELRPGNYVYFEEEDSETDSDGMDISVDNWTLEIEWPNDN